MVAHVKGVEEINTSACVLQGALEHSVSIEKRTHATCHSMRVKVRISEGLKIAHMNAFRCDVTRYK